MAHDTIQHSCLWISFLSILCLSFRRLKDFCNCFCFWFCCFRCHFNSTFVRASKTIFYLYLLYEWTDLSRSIWMLFVIFVSIQIMWHWGCCSLIVKLKSKNFPLKYFRRLEIASCKPIFTRTPNQIVYEFQFYAFLHFGALCARAFLTWDACDVAFFDPPTAHSFQNGTHSKNDE